jgi:hypothetical protein
LVVDGTPFNMRLVADHTEGGVVHVVVDAERTGERYRGELHVSAVTRYRSDFPEATVRTMEAVIRGDLPPGAK